MRRAVTVAVILILPGALVAWLILAITRQLGRLSEDVAWYGP